MTAINRIEVSVSEMFARMVRDRQRSFPAPEVLSLTLPARAGLPTRESLPAWARLVVRAS